MIQLQCYGQTVLTKGSKSKVENISTIITTVKIKTEVELGEWPKVILNFFLFFSQVLKASNNGWPSLILN